MSTCSISVIIPVYNGARFIRDALNSVCTQTLLPTEIVVADDCSTDNTAAVVTAFAHTAPVPITLFRMEKNTGGPYRPASVAFHKTTGNYVCILDADDMFAPDAFETYMAMFAAESSAAVGLATSDFLTFSDTTKEVLRPSFFETQRSLLDRIVTDPSPVGVVLERQDAIRVFASSFALPFKGMLRRETWAALDGPNLQYVHVCDVEFIWRLISTTDYRIRIINRPLMQVRESAASMSSNLILYGTEIVRVLRTMLKATNEPALRRIIRRRLDRELFDLTYTAYKRRTTRALIPAACGLLAMRTRRLFQPSAF